MAFERYSDDGFDNCEPPLCDTDITVEITAMHCSNSILTVRWVVNDVYDRDLDPTDFNKVYWSVNNTDLDLEQSNDVGVSPYRAQIDLSGYTTGVVALQARVGINGTTFSSSPPSMFYINNCNEVSTHMVRAVPCPHPPCGWFSPFLPVYVEENAISTIPTSFPYSLISDVPNMTKCFYIGQSEWDNKIPINYNMGDVLSSINEVQDCYACCGQGNLSCPSGWEDDGRGGQKANFYIEYQTFIARDEIIVIANFTEEDCPLPDDPEDVIWSSGCVATAYGEGPGWPVLRGSGWRGQCFLVYRTDLPLGISVIPKCDDDPRRSGWCVEIWGPDGIHFGETCGDNDGLCLPLISSSSSSSSSSGSSSSDSHQPGGAFLLSDHEEDSALRYDSMKHKFVGLTKEEIEDKLVQLVIDGKVTVSLALYIAIQENIDIET